MINGPREYHEVVLRSSLAKFPAVQMIGAPSGAAVSESVFTFSALRDRLSTFARAQPGHPTASRPAGVDCQAAGRDAYGTPIVSHSQLQCLVGLPGPLAATHSSCWSCGLASQRATAFT